MARWLTVVVLAGAVGFLLAELSHSQRTAEAQDTTAAHSGRLVAVAGKISTDTYGIYLVDLENGTMALYEWLPGPKRELGKLSLLAARNCTFDLQLDEYQTEPSPREIHKLVRQAQRLDSVESP